MLIGTPCIPVDYYSIFSGGSMKKIYLVIIFMLFYSFCAAETKIGKIIQIVGDVDITSFTTGKKIVPDVGLIITSDNKIRTGKKSFVEILLNDGTKLSVKDVSVLNISTLKMSENDPPSRIKLLTGKIRLALKRVYKDRSLILKTPTAVAGVRGTDFGVIASKLETRIVVFDGKVEVANENKNIIKSYILQEREETSVKLDSDPERPRMVPSDMLNEWFDYYEIVEDSKIITKKKRDEGFIDTILRKKKQ
jgi:hypothetical protein